MRVHPGIVWIVFFVLILVPVDLYANLPWQVWTVGNGLPGNNILAVAISEDKMAVGTDEGVAIFDGKNCQWSIPNLPEGIASTSVLDMAYDRHQNLWLATPNGVAVVQKKNAVWYTSADGLPTVAAERLQVKGDAIYVGSFGGFVSRAITPQNGKSSFVPVNYKSKSTSEESSLRLRSVGISGLAMRGGASGWISTKGAGLILSEGLSQYIIDQSSGLTSDWVSAFWVFQGSNKSEHIMVATADGLTLIRNLAPIEQIRIPVKSENTWITCLTTVRYPEEEAPRKGSNSAWDLQTFLGNRALWVGTQSEGLFCYRLGKWTNYSPRNSLIPSKTINRVYFHRGRVLVCTSAGLVIIPIASNELMEFTYLGFGTDRHKTILPNYDASPVNFMVKVNDFWIATEMGLSRFIPPPGTGKDFLQEGKNFSASEEEPEISTRTPGETAESSLLPYEEKKKRFSLRSKKILKSFGGPSRWERFSTARKNLFSDNITSMTADTNGYTWMIFDEKTVGRVKVIPLPKPGGIEKHLRKEKYIWDIFSEDQVPWRKNTQLNVIKALHGHIFFGTEDQGFFVLMNPSGKTETGERKFIWRRYDERQGLYNESVIGFASQVVEGEEPRVAILHPTELTIWDGFVFEKASLDARRDYRCIAGDAQGNLWLGSESGGVIRLTPSQKVLTYTSNAFLESYRITSIIASKEPILGGGTAIWVSCDEGSRSSAPPAPQKVGPWPQSSGASLHYFDGFAWDKWLIKGVRCMLSDGDYLWLGTDKDLQRHHIPALLGDY